MSDIIPIFKTGDALKILKKMDDNSIQTTVTSPPYWGLRDYKSKGQIGNEKNADNFIKKLVPIFMEIHRITKEDGTFWLNIADTYKNKQLQGVPWRLALALQEKGWLLRSDIIWSKPNPMPESCKDRPTRSHEYIFLFSKSKKYYYDIDALRQPHKEITLKRIKTGVKQNHPDDVGMAIPPIKSEVLGERFAHPKGRNERTVWEMITEKYKGAHFATFPEVLAERCIKAGSKIGDTVLDPFVGSGTSCAVAAKLGRKSIGIDISKDFIKIAKERCKKVNLTLESFNE